MLMPDFVICLIYIIPMYSSKQTSKFYFQIIDMQIVKKLPKVIEIGSYKFRSEHLTF